MQICGGSRRVARAAAASPACRGKVIIGQPGCSRFFILGILDVPDPQGLSIRLNKLRTALLADPYFKDVPSIQPEQRKIALAFHAKDDLPKVRREVFTLLQNTEGLRFFSIVSDKMSVLEYVRLRNMREGAYRDNPNELYDYLVRRLFRDRLHKDGGYDIHFAKRGKSDRTTALKTALEYARQRLYDKWGIDSEAPTNVIATSSQSEPGLQATDYFLWSLQRLYERGEDRFLELLWAAFRLVHDINDTRKAGYGVYYTQKKPLKKAAIEGRK